MNNKPIVFISYSHKDENEKDQLLAHLQVLQSAGLIGVWSDDNIGAGDDWKPRIEQAMAQARVAVLLISANFLTSEFILQEEVPVLLLRRAQEGLKVLPVIAKACAWQQFPWLADLQVRPRNGRPIWSKAGGPVDADLAAIANEVALMVENEGITLKLEPAPAETQKSNETTTRKIALPNVDHAMNISDSERLEPDLVAIEDSERELRIEKEEKTTEKDDTNPSVTIGDVAGDVKNNVIAGRDIQGEVINTGPVIHGDVGGHVAEGQQIIQIRDISGQVTVESEHARSQPTAADKQSVTKADLVELQGTLTNIKARIEDEVPPDTKRAALERVAELEETIKATEPDLDTMIYVKNWFTENLPALADIVIDIIVHPEVNKLIEEANDSLAIEYRRRFRIR